MSEGLLFPDESVPQSEGFIPPYRTAKHAACKSLMLRREGYVILAAKEEEKAFQFVNRAIKHSPSLAAGYLLRAQIAFHSMKGIPLERVVNDASRALFRSKNLAIGYEVRGIAYACLGKIEPAIDDLLKAREIGQYSQEVHDTLTKLFLQRGMITEVNQEDGAEDYNQASSFHPGERVRIDAMHFFLQKSHDAESEDLLESLRHVERAWRIGPARLHNELAGLVTNAAYLAAVYHAHEQDYISAEEECTNALYMLSLGQHDPEPELYKLRCRIRLHLEKRYEAAQDAAEAVKLKPELKEELEPLVE